MEQVEVEADVVGGDLFPGAEEIKKGTIRPVKAEDLMVSAISLNIFVFVANPLIQLFVEEKGEEYHQYMERRKQENVEIILSRLRI